MEVEMASQQEEQAAVHAGPAVEVAPVAEGMDAAKAPTVPSVSSGARHQRLVPDEVGRFQGDAEYLEYREMTDMKEPYRVPVEYLVGTKKYVGPLAVESPLVVFINAKSGGRVGARLTSVFYRSLGQAQVFDLAESQPPHVLKRLWENLVEREAQGDKLAAHIRSRLRILAAGGDGTVVWVLKTLQELGLQPPPAVAVMPLGTGNDLSLSLGWGNAFVPGWIGPAQLYRTLKRVADAEVRPMDCWSITMEAPDAALFDELPHSVSVTEADPRKAEGMFWNYLSIGLDAQSAYAFHSLRENRPWAASNRILNQAWYSVFSCTSGWFCGAKPLSNKLKLRVKLQPGDDWQEVNVPPSIRALVLLNLQSYAGGRDIWGLSDTKGLEERGWQPPTFSDGLIEVVGFGTGWHAALAMSQLSPRLHALRLAQCCAVEVDLAAWGPQRVKGDTGLTHMQLDGEPWPQPIPNAAGARGAADGKNGSAAPLKVRIEHHGQSRMLFNGSDIQGGPRIRRLASRIKDDHPSPTDQWTASEV